MAVGQRWEQEQVDDRYLDRLEEGVGPDGDLVTSVYRFTEGDVKGEVAIWQVQVRGDDVLGLIRTIRELRAEVQTWKQIAEIAGHAG